MLRSALSSRRALSSQVERLVVQLDCGDDAAPGVGQLFERLRCIFDELHEWVEKADGPLVMGATQLQALIVSRSVGCTRCSRRPLTPLTPRATRLASTR